LYAQLVVGLVSCLTAVDAAEPAAKTSINPSVPGQVTVPSPGDYRVAQLVLEKAARHLAAPGQYGIHVLGIQGEDVLITAAFRDGKIKVPGRLSVREIIGALEVGETAIKGVYVYESIHNFGETRFSIEATVKDGRISGTWTTAPNPDGREAAQRNGASGKLSGTVKAEAQLAKENAFTSKADWPCYSGPTTSLAATPTGLKLTKEFAALLPVWRSEEMVPHGNGNSSNGHGRNNSSCRTPGGGASLVVADGKVICSYYQPAGKEFVPGMYTAWSKVQPTGSGEKDVEHLMVNHYKIQPDNPRWKWMVEKCLLRADEVYLCLDAATGKTLWKTVFPEATQYHAGHKQGPVNNTPCIGDGRVYVVSTIGTVRALDLATGKEVWSTPGALPNVCGGDKDGNNAPIFVGKTVVTGNHRQNLIGIDAATGKLLWTLEGKSDWLQVPAKWVSGGTEYAISLSQVPSVLCIEPQTGKVLWEQKVPGPVTKGVSVVGDVLYLTANGCDKPNTPNPAGVTQAWNLSKEGMKERWQTPTTWANGNCPPSVDGKLVLVGGISQSVLLDAATGKELAKYVGQGPFNEGHTTLADDRAILHIDGSHGGNHFVPLDTNPSAFPTPVSRGWIPPHPPTTAYHNKAMTWPVVEGQLFMRGHDGVYCYDLRKK
jgi:outer membrane protein assembly factor BamB